MGWVPAAVASLAVLIATFAIAACPAGAADAPAGVADLVAQMPAQSAEAGQQALAGILKLGPDAVAEVAGMVVAPGAGNDSKARFALSGLAFYVARPDGEADRALFARAILGRLDAATDPQVKAFLISLLQVAGKAEAVGPLIQLLGDPVLCEPATRALLTIGGEGVPAALLAALPGAQGDARLTFVQALGELRSGAAVKAILPLAADADARTRHTALAALANIGDPAAAETLAKAAEAGTLYERGHATALYLAFARRLAEAGQQKECARVCRDLIRTRTEPRDRHILCDAAAILVGVEGKGALDDLLALLANPDKKVREAALALTQRIPGKPVTRKLEAAAKGQAPEVRAGIVGALGHRGDASALPMVLDALKDGEKVVRLAAVGAAVAFANDKAIAGLLAALSTDQADEVQAIKAALLRIPGEKLLPAVAAALPRASVPGRVALLQILGSRRAGAQIEIVLAGTKDDSPDVRVAALRALGQVADPAAMPRLLPLLLNAPEGAEQDAAQQAVVRACERIPDAGSRSEPLLAALPAATGAGRARVLAALASIGGDKAVQAAVADTRSADAGVQDAAIRALAEWKDAAAVPELLKLAKDAPSTRHRVVATRGVVRLAGIPASGSVEARVRMFQEAIAAAPRPDEKRLALGGLSEIRTIPALQAAAALMEDENLAEDAAAAVVRIALPEKETPKEQPLKGAEVVAALTRVIAVTEDAKLKDQAAAYLASMPKPDTANLAQGKPVKATVPTEGNNVPEKAVDGNASDLGAAWYGHLTPAALTIDLQKVEKIDSVHAFYFWDGSRYYQYTVEVSTDEKTWTKVVDQSANTRASTSRGVMHSFAPVEARYVRINTLKNSANQAVHLVELKVYAAGTAPAAVVAVAPKPDAEGYIPLFNGKDLTGWTGSTKGYVVENGTLVCLKEGGGRLQAEEEYSDFSFRFEFKLEPGANNGVGIRYASGDAAYNGMEIQILDDTADVYKNLQPYQYHGSIYGVVPCKRGFQKPVGEWNSEEIVANGRHITVILNGTTIVDADLDKVMAEGGPADHKAHPGLLNPKGFIGFLGHGARIEFRNIRIKELGGASGK